MSQTIVNGEMPMSIEIKGRDSETPGAGAIWMSSKLPAWSSVFINGKECPLTSEGFDRAERSVEIDGEIREYTIEGYKYAFHVDLGESDGKVSL